MLNYATRLPPGAPVELLDNGMIRKKIHSPYVEKANLMAKLVSHFSKYPDYKVVTHGNFSITPIRNGYSYQYDMMRCGLLSLEERQFVNLVGSFHNYYGRLAFHQAKEGLRGKYEEFPKLYSFLREVVEENKYWDIHSGNIMLDENWDYVLIDLEGFIRSPDGPANDWFRDD